VSAKPPLLLFVCTGNICRSPIAEVVAVDAARRAGIPLRVASAGTSALTGSPAYDLAQAAVEEIGLSLAAHRSAPLTRELVDEAALVVAATGRHRNDLRYFFPAHASKIVSFDDVTGLGDLSDPLGGGADEFTKTRELVRDGMPRVLAALALAGPDRPSGAG